MPEQVLTHGAPPAADGRMAADIGRAMVRNDELIDRVLIRRWLLWGFCWLMLAPTVGVIISTKFNYPEFFGTQAWSTFGRLRPVHVNGVIWGAFSTLFIGLAYYVTPRLAGVRVWRERWAYPLLWLWNLNLAAAFIGLTVFGTNRGWEAGELWLPNVLLLTVGVLAISLQLLMTIAHRVQRDLYVSLWYLIGALVWTDINLLLLVIGPYWTVAGINNAALHGLYIHYVVGLWITPAGYVLIYYFLPAAVRAPIYSHKLSLIGFWSLAFFYPFVGIHHYLYSPIADWAETIAIVSSMMLIIPVWTVLQNFFGTMIGKWQEFGRNLPAKFLIAGAVYVWPRITGSELASFTLANWGFWLVTVGISAMGLVLSAQGLQQGFMLMAQSEFLETVAAIRPYWWVRTFTGISMDTGMSLVVYALLKGSLARRSA